jgi:glutathione S-transferase
MITEQVNDLFRLLMVPYNAIYYKEPGFEEKQVELEKALNELVPVGLKFIERLFEQNQRDSANSGFLVGGQITYADVKLVNLYDWFNLKRQKILDQVPLLKAHAEAVRNSAQLKAHYERSDKDITTIYF